MREHPTSTRRHPTCTASQQHTARSTPACGGVDPEVFFGPTDSPEGGPIHSWERQALSVCAACPLSAACLAAALTFPARDQHGVVGRMTAGQRRAALRAAHHRAPLPSAAGPADPREQLPRDVDELVVTQLMAGGPLVGTVRPEEVAEAAIRLHRAGHQPGWIATRLGVGDRQVYRWLARHHSGTPLTPPRGARRTRVPA